GLEQGDEALGDRAAGLDRRVGDRRRTDTGLIGEGRALEADDHDADDAAGDALRVERAGEDLADGVGDVRVVEPEDEQAGDDVEDRHTGNQLVGDLRDGADAAEDDQGDENGEDDSEDERGEGAGQDAVVASGGGAHLGEGLVGLEYSAADDAEYEDRDGEQSRQRRGHGSAEAPEGDGQIFEGAAVDDSVLVDLTVLHAEGAFDELRAHAQQAGHDHPERRTRTAEGDGDADTGDVAESDGPRQGRGQ